MSDKCPGCGAEAVSPFSRTFTASAAWACGSFRHLDVLRGFEWVDSTDCIRAQLAQRDAELEKLRADLGELDRHVHERNDDTGTVDAAIVAINAGIDKVTALEAELEELRAVVETLPLASIAQACESIEAADNRAMAADGPVPCTASVMSADELQHCLSTLWSMREAAKEAPDAAE